MISQQLQQRLAMQNVDNPIYQQQQTYGMDPNSMAHIPQQMPPSTAMMGNATPFASMAGNATPFANMGNATPFNPLAGNTTPWNSMSNYAATPFHSFSLDNTTAGATSISNDPRFPMPMLEGDMMMMPQDDVMLPVDQGFSRRANANNRVGATTSTRTRAGSFASRGGKSGRPAPVYSRSRRGSRSTNGESCYFFLSVGNTAKAVNVIPYVDGNDATDVSAVDVEVDALETSSQKSSYSRSSSKGAGASRKRSRNSPSRAPHSQGGAKAPLRLVHTKPVRDCSNLTDSLSRIATNPPESTNYSLSTRKNRNWKTCAAHRPTRLRGISRRIWRSYVCTRGYLTTLWSR